MNSLVSYDRSKSGSVTVEFAIIFPVLVILLFGLIELANLIDFHRKLDLVASTTGDLASELIYEPNSNYSDRGSDKVSTSRKKICALLKVGSKNYYPLNDRNVSLNLSYYTGNKPEWTGSLRGEPSPNSEDQVLPDWFMQRYSSELNEAKSTTKRMGIFRVHVESKYDPIFLESALTSINVLPRKKDYWVFLRNEDGLTCLDCSDNFQCLN
ncbi:TadE family protein [Ochrobactrum sp. Marseille-Q0166]|uniref:TadE/TadG family type IV pilus assembly protein n=1 Tax=Ochrobactrum sp. Marseille-Q0166 TaxID=2761105 RepID=UPI0016557197|nr:TadE family protein [Ochrobactrum sp. Marseille-Q0166]MBC8719092.1 pilus assembly protein [Ochrobactrum sp. Marseille-Q0166]